MERDELAGWLRLGLAEGVGSEAARRLLAAFGLPAQVFAQSLDALAQVVSPAQARALHAVPSDRLAARLDATWDWLRGADERGAARAVVTLGDARYPGALLAADDPPVLLYLLGAPAFLERSASFAPPGRCLAVVGSRNPTAQGAANARAFAQALRSAGLTIVSGLALGVDGAAHEGALDAAVDDGQPATIAVVGTGLDRVYPRRHLALARRIAQHGLVVSEYPLGTPPLAPNFPKRNRIIAGLSQGTLVVEAALASGSLITARLAAEQGREVFAIPGSIHAPQSRGCHALIRQGAKLVESAQDVLEELHLPAPATAAAPPPPATAQDGSDDAVLQALGFDPAGLDALVARTGIDAAALQVRLLELELSGEVARLPGGLFQRVGQA
ncbi:DNA-processing protein DprA [Xylophilus sp.]|uniref:DNA-processing protein DprA n=1 Tax=Xylophilus sp. TaxID=2653893 RepID=UPI0013BA0B9A|nr:DNA-processing protein DprA [Xylophilus sp.]KAF1048247.1 MAG: DNA processing protein DprA [Xylophilus sp.]